MFSKSARGNKGSASSAIVVSLIPVEVNSSPAFLIICKYLLVVFLSSGTLNNSP